MHFVMVGSWIIFAAMQAEIMTWSFKLRCIREIPIERAWIFLCICIYMHILFSDTSQFIYGSVVFLWKLWSAKAKWSNDLIKYGNSGLPMNCLAVFLNHILQESSKSEDSLLCVRHWYLQTVPHQQKQWKSTHSIPSIAPYNLSWFPHPRL